MVARLARDPRSEPGVSGTSSRRAPTAARSRCAGDDRGKTCRDRPRSRSVSSRRSQPEFLAFDNGSLDYHRPGGDDSRRVARNGKLQARDRAKRGIVHLRFGVAVRHFHVLQHGRSGVGGYSTRADRAAARDRRWASTVDELIRVLFARQRAARESVCCRRASSGYDPSLPPKSSTIPRPRARCSTASATRIATATAIAKRPTASRSSLVRGTLPDIVVSRGRHAVEEEHGRDRHPDAGATADVRRALEHEPQRQAADVQPRLPVARALGLPDPADAAGASRRSTPTRRSSGKPTTTPHTSSSCARRRARRASRSRARCRTSRRPTCR